MMNDYLCIEVNQRNELRTRMSFNLFQMQFHDVDVKIDTGCPFTMIPLRAAGLSEHATSRLKRRDCENPEIVKHISFGVNDTEEKREQDKENFRNKNYLQVSSISFRHSFENVSLGGFQVGNAELLVSYDRTGNVLIGMDVLRLFDVHMGISAVTGTHTMLACPADSLSSSYREALSVHFGIDS